MQVKEITFCGERVKELRKKRGFPTQQSLADELNVSLDSVKSWEQNRVCPEAQRIVQIAVVLECDIDYLFGRQPTPNKEFAYVSNYTGLSESSVELLKRWNEGHSKHVSETIDLLLSYREAVQAAGRPYDDAINAINALVKHANATLHYSNITGRIIDRPAEDAPVGLYPWSEINTDDANILRINGILKAMKAFYEEKEADNGKHNKD